MGGALSSFAGLIQYLALAITVLFCLTTTQAHGATRSGTLASGASTSYDITLPVPQSGMRLVVSSTANSSIFLYSGSSPTPGSLITESSQKTLHPLLIEPGQLSDGGSYHLRIQADASLSYSFTDDLKYVSSTLSWDNGSTLEGTSRISQPDSAGGDYLFKITGRSPQHPAWRNTLKVVSGEADLYLQQGSAPLYGGSYSSEKAGSDAIFLPADSSLDGQEWYLRVHARPGSTWQLASGDLFVQELAWDGGSSATGTSGLSHPSTAAGDYFFRITAQNSVYGAWRTVLNVASGEANLQMQSATVPLDQSGYTSARPGPGAAGSDGIVLASSQFGENQSWYIRITSEGSATWSIFSGEIHVRDLGTVAATPGSLSNVTIGPEGTAYFKASVDADTQAWRIWLNGSGNALYVSKGKAPVKNPWTEEAEQFETGQALLVPPYLTSALYVVGVKGTPGSSFSIDSRKQAILTPSALSGYSQGGGAANFDFTLPGQGNSGGFGYKRDRHLHRLHGSTAT